jgi:membrane-associated phospholipid phosphatase
LRRVLGYGLAVGTAYARMDHDAHWLSDTAAGAGLGLATARFVMKQRERGQRRARFELVPVTDGVAVRYAFDLAR